MRKLVTVLVPGTVELSVGSPRMEGLGPLVPGPVTITVPTEVTLRIPVECDLDERCDFYIRQEALDTLSAAVDGGLKVFINPVNSLVEQEVELEVWKAEVWSVDDLPEVASPEVGAPLSRVTRVHPGGPARCTWRGREGCECPYCTGRASPAVPRPSAVLEVESADRRHPGLNEWNVPFASEPEDD